MQLFFHRHVHCYGLQLTLDKICHIVNVVFEEKNGRYLLNKEELIEQVLLLPLPAMDYHLGKHLKELFPHKAVLEVASHEFDVEGFANAGKCTLTPSPWSYNQVQTYLATIRI
jgi:hypothetical protein